MPLNWTTSSTLPLTKPRSSNHPLYRFTRNSYPGVFCAAVILLLTGLPGSCFPKVKPIIGLDKIAHMIMYLGFAYITLWGYRKPYQENGKAYQRKALWLVLAISIGFGALTEIMQETLVPSRTGSVYDWIADVIGSILGVAIYYFFHRSGNNLQNQSFCK